MDTLCTKKMISEISHEILIKAEVEQAHIIKIIYWSTQKQIPKNPEIY